MKTDFLHIDLLPLLMMVTTLGLGACNGSDSTSSVTSTAAAANVEPDPQSLCITPDCGSKEVLVHVPEAENLIFNDDGRLFVTGEELYEIVRTNGTFEAKPVTIDGAHSASLGGLAIANGVLYMNDETDRGLWAGKLQADMHMQKIHVYSGYPTPNGLAVGPDAALYSTTGPTPDFATLTSVVRVELDPHDPFKVLSEEKVFGFPEVPAANGIVLKGSTFYMVAYLSDLPQVSSVQSFDVAADGTVGPLHKVFSSPLATFDDLEVIGDRVIVANNFENSLLMFGLDGKQLADSGLIFSGPAAITYGRPPMFSATDILVAERGLLGEGDSDYGNDLAVFRRHAN